MLDSNHYVRYNNTSEHDWDRKKEAGMVTLVKREAMEAFETVEQFAAHLVKRVEESGEPVLADFGNTELIVGPEDEVPDIVNKYCDEESRRNRQN